MNPFQNLPRLPSFKCSNVITSTESYILIKRLLISTQSISLSSSVEILSQLPDNGRHFNFLTYFDQSFNVVLCSHVILTPLILTWSSLWSIENDLNERPDSQPYSLNIPIWNGNDPSYYYRMGMIVHDIIEWE